MTSELEAIQLARGQIGEIAGFAVVVDGSRNFADSPPDRPASKILAAFVGPYGRHTVSGSLGALDWAGVLPGTTEVLSTWSQYSDASTVCVVEGDFYAEAWGRRPRIGVDDTLARTLVGEFGRHGPACVNELNGLFSGFLFSRERQRLWFFLDQSGSRMLYYRLENGRCEVASSVYGLSAGRTPLRLDPIALNEDMVFGAPLEHRMVFQGVRVVAPGKVIEFDGHRFLEHRYFRFPQRRAKMSRAEIGESICGAIERRARFLGLDSRPSSIGISGGKDSRVIFGAIVHAGVRPRAFTFRTSKDEVDAALGVQVAVAVGLPSTVLNIYDLPDSDEIVGVSCDSAILSDGFTAGPGFLAFSASAARHSRILFTGFAGDCLSGSWSGVEPWRARTIEELSAMNQEFLGYVVPPPLASALLLPELRVPLDDLLQHWRECYLRENEDFADLVSTHVGMRIGQRNRRWGATFYQSMRAVATPTQLFGARDVMEAYLTVPVSALKGQKAHILAAEHRFPALGRIPTSKSLGKLPLNWEPWTRIPLRWRYSRRIQKRKREPTWQAAPSSPAPVSQRTRRFGEALQNASMIDQAYLRREFLPRLGGPVTASLHKVAATILHAEYGISRRFLVPPFFLSQNPS